MEQNNNPQIQGGSPSPLLLVLFIGQLITLLAIAGVGYVVQREAADLRAAISDIEKAAPARPARDDRPQQPQEYKNWASLIRDYNISVGPEDAPVTIIEFSDFQCPFCNRFYTQSYRQLLKDYDGKLRFVYKNLPLSQIHPSAESAAIALQCAAREGKGWDMHDKLFDNYRSLSDETIRDLAKEIGLGDSWTQCYEKRETADEVQQDSKDAMEAGARGTPAFLINGKFVSGAQPLQSFKAEIDRLLSN
ncbi:MAG: hypothetical protein D6761_01970 [Candidatus Dadabacteria bacterium]|nr:MAG: hypothetical protein D6761_01970 [Candidatus Dadabacteria bacterium]